MKQFTRVYIMGGTIGHVETQDTPFTESKPALTAQDSDGAPIAMEAREFIFDSGDAVETHTRARELLDSRLTVAAGEVQVDGGKVLGANEGKLEVDAAGQVLTITDASGVKQAYLEGAPKS